MLIANAATTWNLEPLQLVPCFIKSAEEEGTTCGQRFVNDKRISVVAEGAVATGAQSMHATIGSTKPIITGVAITPVNGASKTGVVLERCGGLSDPYEVGLDPGVP